MIDHRFPAYLVLKQGIEGEGVFVTKDIKKGETIFTMSGEILTYPTRTSVQVGKDEHIEDVIAGHINHNCEPNSKVIQETREFVSLKDIKAGEEITFDYNANEDFLASPFICQCCNQAIKGKTQNRKTAEI